MQRDYCLRLAYEILLHLLRRGWHDSFEKQSTKICDLHVGWIAVDVLRLVFASDEP